MNNVCSSVHVCMNSTHAGYTHDAQCVIYHGPDGRYTGHEICFAYNENTLTIVDVTSKTNVVMLSRTPYKDVSYSHQVSWDMIMMPE